ncbi:glycoside hydrolase family 16 protein [Aplosporella prunicola CBS 121167]|uniref:endo-1,3(4)-beta-glucanase n=1 Tax=Aplosporella prunicola CBS 121167 TaxID=1176127 RepID=A0A6A6BD49_9PEZI|nr:glycoside hydrolase family 16 protein [Aplosporella prunicola CBS 121167]KAF2141508.1 glycoside hydrolase family 16 protein [Aplosporella prunicola CBS 121167]
MPRARSLVPALLAAAAGVASAYDNTTAGYAPFVGADGEASSGGTEHTILLDVQTPLAAQAYSLTATYDASNWFDVFAVQALGTRDPTGGFVNYLSQADAQARGLYRIQNGQVYMGVDHTNTMNTAGPGRPSVRIQSKAAFKHGLFILDLAHMPGSICGTWPAYWLVGPNWPNNGEIDIIEGVNQQARNQMTLHTRAGCNVDVGEGGQTGTLVQTNCNANSAYDGCSTTSTTANTIGSAFNAAGGGVYASFWNAGSIQHWYWPASAVPNDIRQGSPVPLGWGTPMAHFHCNGCSFDDYISGNSVVFDTTFCGQWAGAVWASGGCAGVTGRASCVDYVANDPGAFADAYWLVNSLKVYGV